MIDKGINVKKIDLSGVSFPTSDASTCALIYTAVKNTYGFPLYLTNFKINDEKRDAILVNPVILDNQTIINLNDCHLIVAPAEISVGKGVYGASLESIVDSNGNKRFVEWILNTNPSSGITFSYAKASLSGTHLMIVIAGTMATGDYAIGGLANIVLPLYIGQKIRPVSGNIVEYKNVYAIASNYQTQTIQTGLFINQANNTLTVNLVSPIAITTDRNFRIQYDLLIDSE